MNFSSPEALGALAFMLAGWACRETLFQLWQRFSKKGAGRRQPLQRSEGAEARTVHNESRSS